jgi:hypothetical protein
VKLGRTNFLNVIKLKASTIFHSTKKFEFFDTLFDKRLGT